MAAWTVLRDIAQISRASSTTRKGGGGVAGWGAGAALPGTIRRAGRDAAGFAAAERIPVTAFMTVPLLVADAG
jgi:hypothetical protein